MNRNGKSYRGKYPTRRQVESTFQIMASAIPVDCSVLYPHPGTPLENQTDLILFALGLWGEGYAVSTATQQQIGECLLHQWRDRQDRFGESLRTFLLGYHINGNEALSCFRPGHIAYANLLHPSLSTWLPTVSIAVPLLIHPPDWKIDSPYYFSTGEKGNGMGNGEGNLLHHIEGVRFYTKESLRFSK